MNRILYLIVFLPVLLKAQLLPSIGLSVTPSDNVPVCTEPFYTGSFYTSGYQVGDTVPDFKLYAINGDSLVLSKSLLSGKPALLIAGSLTCPVFRAKVATINQVVSTYSPLINVYVIYTIDAHPTDTSVYFGYVNVTSQNTSAGILFPQPVTYGGRKAMVDTMDHWVNLNAPVFIDGPCNGWWHHYGPAPNNAYLIDTNGTVALKHGWFHKYPDNIYCDLDSILNFNSGLCVPTTTASGNFSLHIVNYSVTGQPGATLYDYVDIVNPTSLSTTVKIKKLQKNHPQSWQTSFCADICYGTADDSITVSIDPYDTLKFSLDFYTGGSADSGSVKVGFKNTMKAANNYTLLLKAYTEEQTTGVTKTAALREGIRLLPNPASCNVRIDSDDKEFNLEVLDAFGRVVLRQVNDRSLNVSALSPGIYLLVYESMGQRRAGKLIVCRGD
jgi:hypothetical protein